MKMGELIPEMGSATKKTYYRHKEFVNRGNLSNWIVTPCGASRMEVRRNMIPETDSVIQKNRIIDVKN